MWTDICCSKVIRTTILRHSPRLEPVNLQKEHWIYARKWQNDVHACGHTI